MAEVRASIAAGNVNEPGKSSLELAARAAFPLIVDGRLNADRGTSGNDQPDRRTPGEVLDVMRQSPHGIHQLGQALRDFADGVAIRAVDEEGGIRLLAEGEGEMALNDILLRGEFPPPGKSKARRPVWSRTHKRVHGTAPAAGPERRYAGADVTGDDDPTAGWDRDEEAA